MAFARAEQILRTAGMSVGPHPAVTPHALLDYRDNVVGMRVLDAGFTHASKRAIALVPARQGAYRVVERVEAAIAVTWL